MKPRLPKRSNLTFEQVNAVLSYDPETGHLTWKPRGRDMFWDDRSFKTWNTRFANKRAGSLKGTNGYENVGIFNSLYLSHRIAWLLHYGEWVEEIDHIDHDPLNNRIVNLREADRKTNMQNTSMSSANTSGFNGVHWHKWHGKWCAAISVNSKKVQLGLFTNFDDAVAAREEANKFYGYHPSHGI